MAEHIVVIGAGFGGMAAALRMRAKGYEVTLLERNDQLGGRARVFEKDGVWHDAGPTVITAPFLFDELFELFGKRKEDYFTLVPLDPWYRFYFQDGTNFDYGGTVEKIDLEIRRLSPQDIQGYHELVAHSRRIFDLGFGKLSDQPFHAFSDMLRQGPAMIRLKSYKTVWEMIGQYVQNPYLRQALSISPLLVGGDPFRTTSIYSLIHYLERKWGIHFAMGGTGKIVKGLEKLLREQGVQIHKSCSVKDFQIENGHVSALHCDNGKSFNCDKVIFNGDPAYLYKYMLPARGQKLSARLKSRRSKLSMGLFVLYFGTNKLYPHLAHHTIWMGKRFKGLLHDIFHKLHLPKDFSLYIHRPTATDPSFAPPGCESFYILCPVPNLKAGLDWEIEGPALKERIVKALEETIMPGLKSNIFGDFYMTPEDFKQDYLSEAGAGFSIAPYFTQSAWFRYHNKSEGPLNLYLCGAGTHPGAGVPGVLSSAKVLERLIPPAMPFVSNSDSSFNGQQQENMS